MHNNSPRGETQARLAELIQHHVNSIVGLPRSSKPTCPGSRLIRCANCRARAWFALSARRHIRFDGWLPLCFTCAEVLRQQLGSSWRATSLSQSSLKISASGAGVEVGCKLTSAKPTGLPT
jgi:hypothetical protein